MPAARSVACVSAEAICDLMARLESETALTAANELAVAFWSAGEVEQAIALLDQAVALLEQANPLRFDFLSTLGEIMFEERSSRVKRKKRPLFNCSLTRMRKRT